MADAAGLRLEALDPGDLPAGHPAVDVVVRALVRVDGFQVAERLWRSRQLLLQFTNKKGLKK